MTTFSTRRRQGFDLPREEGGGLGVYGLPAVGPVHNNSADQVSRVLAAVGSTFANVASLNAQEQARLDRRMAGVADEAVAVVAPRLIDEIDKTTIVNAKSTDEEIRMAVDGLVQSEASKLDFGSSKLASDAFASAMRGRLTSAAYTARDAKLRVFQADALNDIASGIPSAAGDATQIAAIIDDMREVKPDISGIEIQSLLARSASSIAEAGLPESREKIANLLSQVDDPLIKATAWAQYERRLNENDRVSSDKAREAAENAVSAAIRSDPNSAMATLAAHEGSISAMDREVLASRIKAAKDARVGEARSSAYEDIGAQLSKLGPEAALHSFDRYVQSGILSEADRAGVSKSAQQYATDQKRAEVYSVQFRMARGEMSPSDAIGGLDAIARDLEERTERAAIDPYSFDAVDPSVAGGVLSKIGEIAAQAFDQQQVRSAVEYGVSEIEAGRLWVPSAVRLSSGERSPKELADEAMSAYWSKVQSQTNDPAKQRTMIYQAMSRSPLASLPQFKSEMSGVASLGFAVANENDPAKRKAAMDSLNQIMSNYDEMMSVDPTVATRHLPDGMGPVFEYIGAAREVIPENDVDAWRAAMGTVRQNRKLADFMAEKDIDEIVDRAVKSAGLGKNAPPDVRRDARNRIEVLMVGLGLDASSAASRASSSMRNTYKKFDGGVLASGNAQTGKYVELGTLKEIMLDTIPTGERDGLRLVQENSSKMYRLVDENGLHASESVPVERALDLVRQAQEFASGITGEREEAISLWLQSEEDRFPVAPTAFGPGSPMIGRLGAAVAGRIKSRAVRSAMNKIASGYVDGMADAASDPFVRAARRVGGGMAGVVRIPEADPKAYLDFIETPGPGRR